jgi:hypothetical protein
MQQQQQQHQQHPQHQQQYRYNRRSNFDELRKNETTSRAGLGWETGEEEKVLSMRLDKSSYDDIAVELKRTSRSIQTRLYQSVCKSVEVDNENEAELIQKYDIDAEDFALFKTQRQEKMNKFESRKEGGSSGSKPYRKPKRFDTIDRGDRGDAKSQYVTPYENKNYSIRNELNTLRQEVYELRRIVNEMR